MLTTRISVSRPQASERFLRSGYPVSLGKKFQLDNQEILWSRISLQWPQKVAHPGSMCQPNRVLLRISSSLSSLSAISAGLSKFSGQAKSVRHAGALVRRRSPLRRRPLFRRRPPLRRRPPFRRRFPFRRRPSTQSSTASQRLSVTLLTPTTPTKNRTFGGMKFAQKPTWSPMSTSQSRVNNRSLSISSRPQQLRYSAMQSWQIRWQYQHSRRTTQQSLTTPESQLNSLKKMPLSTR